MCAASALSTTKPAETVLPMAKFWASEPIATRASCEATAAIEAAVPAAIAANAAASHQRMLSARRDRPGFCEGSIR